MEAFVEIRSGVDQLRREVYYWIAFRGTTSVKVTEWATATAWAQARSGEHEVGVIDRSDKESGLLRGVLGR